ncbi:MAG: HlyD family efflux transporter periplasmic adaptor subunit [Vicinamibacteria bacterium]|nr:HlyD family efflux transporter periplasmic adaptor subunit [Vicinamibacteria bacterium]
MNRLSMAFCCGLLVAPAVLADVAARGRLEPRNGARRVAGPAEMVAVVARLDVEEGDALRRGQVIAVTDTFEVREAAVARLRAALASAEAAIVRTRADAENARQEEERAGQLARQGVGPASEAERWQKRREAADAALAQAEADLGTAQASLKLAETERDRALVRSPIDGRVLKIHARQGERVTEHGIAELGETGVMYAVAEVYETDVPKVKAGQRAEVKSPALARPLAGVVERVGLKVGRLHAVGADPAARNDARAVEVKIRLDDSAAAAAFTDLEVEILIRAR